MEFVALPFPYFFLLLLTGIWALRRHRVGRNALLVVASAWFAWKWQPLFLLCLVGSSLANYLVGEWLAQSQTPRLRRAVVVSAVLGNLALLGFFKYAGFFLENVDALLSWLGLSLHAPLVQVMVPLGISFYTFQAISYVSTAIAERPCAPETSSTSCCSCRSSPNSLRGPSAARAS